MPLPGLSMPYISAANADLYGKLREDYEHATADEQAANSAANELLSADNISAGAVKKKADARFERISAMKRRKAALQGAIEAFGAIRTDCNKEYGRAAEAIATAEREIRQRLIEMGYTEEIAPRVAFLHPRVMEARAYCEEVAGVVHTGCQSWINGANRAIQELDVQMEHAVRSAMS